MIYWGFDWLWGLPFVIGTIVFHTCIFVMVQRLLSKLLGKDVDSLSAACRIMTIATVALVAVTLHAFEAATWAGLYVYLNALPDFRTAMLYSLSAVTAYGHAEVFLENRWKLLGAVEALNGVILLGLTTAFVFAAIEAARHDRALR